MEYEYIVITLIYVRRLIKRSEGRLVLTRHNWRAILFISAVVAIKVWDDFHPKNPEYRCISSALTVSRINNLEEQLLISIEHCCNVSPSAYAETHFEIQSMITMFKLKKVQEPRRKITGKKKLFPPKFAKVHAAEVSQHKKLSSPDKTPLSVPASDEGHREYSRARSCRLATSDVATCLPNASSIVFEGSQFIERSPAVINKHQTSCEIEKHTRRNLKAPMMLNCCDNTSPSKGSVQDGKTDCNDQGSQTSDSLHDSPLRNDINSPMGCESIPSMLFCFPLLCCCRSEQQDDNI